MLQALQKKIMSCTKWPDEALRKRQHKQRHLFSAELWLILLQGDLSCFYMSSSYQMNSIMGDFIAFPSSFSDLSQVTVCDNAISRCPTILLGAVKRPENTFISRGVDETSCRFIKGQEGEKICFQVTGSRIDLLSLREPLMRN